MGKRVNVVLPSGEVVSVDQETATQSQLPAPSAEQGAAIAGERIDKERADHNAGTVSSVLGGPLGRTVFGGDGAAAAADEGFVDSASFGAYGKIAGLIDPDYAHELALRADQHPYAHGAGELASMFLPVGGPAMAADAGHLVEAGLLADKARPLTRGAETLAKMAGRATEGAIIGGGAHVASTNVTGDPLTIEGTLASMGTGVVLNVGMGAVADKIAGAGAKSGEIAESAKTVKADLDLVNEARDKGWFSKPPESWETLQTSLKKSATDEQKLFGETKKAAQKYNDYLTPKNIDGALRQAEKARNEIQARLGQTKYGKAISETGDALSTATEEVGKAKSKADAFTSSTEDWPKTMRQIDTAIKNVRERWAPRDWEPVYKPKLQGYQGDVGEDGLFNRGEAMHTASRKMPISKETDELLKSFSERASNIRKLRQGGVRLDKDNWVADPSAKPDPARALEELHKLRADFSKKYGGEAFPDLPDVPKVSAPLGAERPPAGPSGQMDEVKQLSSLSRSISDGISSARAKFKAGDLEGAAEELRGLQTRAKWEGVNDLVLPTIPAKTEMPPEVAESFKVPKDFKELVNMGPERAKKLSNLMERDEATKAAFERLAGELGINPADGLAGLNAKLGKYIEADKRLVKYAADQAEAENGGGLLAFLRRGAKRFVRAGAARAADTALGGGLAGVAGRVVAGDSAGVVMNKVEDMVSGAMMRGKLNAQSSIGTLFSKLAPPMSRAVRELGPITAYLQAGLWDGKPDHDDDITQQALRRVNEAYGAGPTVNDAAYVAVQSLLGHPSNVAWKMHQKIVGDVQHLIDVAPKDPGIAFHGLKSDWSPSHEEAIEYAYRIEAVTNPLKAIARSIAGDGHPAAVESLWLRWPALMQTAAGEFAFQLPEYKGMNIDQASNYSHVFRTPITGLMNPEVGLTIQGIYMQSAAPPQQSGPAPSKAPTGNPVGRPAAVQSQVAGSSVAGLLSQ